MSWALLYGSVRFWTVSEQIGTPAVAAIAFAAEGIEGREDSRRGSLVKVIGASVGGSRNRIWVQNSLFYSANTTVLIGDPSASDE